MVGESASEFMVFAAGQTVGGSECVVGFGYEGELGFAQFAHGGIIGRIHGETGYGHERHKRSITKGACGPSVAEIQVALIEFGTIRRLG